MEEQNDPCLQKKKGKLKQEADYMRNSRSLCYHDMVRVYWSAISPATMNNNFFIPQLYENWHGDYFVYAFTLFKTDA